MSVRQVKIGCTFTYVANAPTPVNYIVEPNESPIVRFLEQDWQTDPATASIVEPDLFGNRIRRLVLPSGESTCSYHAIVEVPDELDASDPGAQQLPPEQIPTEYLTFTLPSRYCPSDLFRAHAWKLFGTKPADQQRVQDIMDYVHGHLSFEYGASDSASTALDVFVKGWGVCRDYAQLGVTFCRALNIPARYAFGYLPLIEVPYDPRPMDFAAWMEVYLGDRWYTFDPRNNARRKGRVVIGRGRDAADIAMATTFGNPWLKQMTVVAEEVPAGQ